MIGHINASRRSHIVTIEDPIEVVHGDHMSIVDWINLYVPGGMSSKLGQLLDVAYNIEYGAESSVQSSLNMLYLLGFVGPGQFRTFGKSNEKFHVHGGNDQLASGLAARLAGQITANTPLTAIGRSMGTNFCEATLAWNSWPGTALKL